MMALDIEKLSKAYLKQGTSLTVALALVTLLVMQVARIDLAIPVVVSSVFALVVCYAIGLIWRRVAQRSPESLPTFFTAVSGFRLLLALAAMLVYYLVDSNDSMLRFFLVFMAFYVVLLVHHSIFFAKVSNRS